MKMLIGVVFIGLIALLGSRWSFSRIHLPVFARHLFVTGSEFIIIGFLMGPFGVNLLDTHTLNQLHPLITLGLGWVGLLFGLQLDISLLKRFPKIAFPMAIIQSVLVFLIMLPTMYLALGTVLPVSGLTRISAAVLLAATASCTAQASLALLQKELQLGRCHLMTLLRVIASIDGIVAIIIAGILSWVAAGISAGGPMTLPPVLLWAAASVFLGFLSGLILDLLLDTSQHQSEILIAVTGILAFIGGLTVFFQGCILFITCLAGFYLANRKNVIRIHAAMATLEKPIYIMLLLVGGAMIRSIHPQEIVLIFFYIVVRILSKFAAGHVNHFLFRPPINIPGTFGLCLLSEGGVSLALVLAYRQLLPGPAADIVLMVVLSGILLNEILAVPFTRLVFRSTGRIQ